MKNKSELLQKLKIDRSRAERDQRGRLWQQLLLLIVCVGAAIWLTLKFALPDNRHQPEAGTPELGKTSSLSSQQGDNVVATPPSGHADTAVESTSLSTSQSTSQSTLQAAMDVENRTILNASGYITARRIATVSAEIMGLITDVKVEEGMSVTKGQVLASLDDALARVNHDFAKAQVEVLMARRDSIVANLDEARRNHRRVTNNDFSSDSERSGALATMKSLTADLNSAEADIRVAQIEVRRQRERLDDHTIRAPFAGVVTVKNAQPGEIVAPASAGGGFTRTGICTIVDMTSLEIEVDVNESFIGRVFSGQSVQAHLDAYPDWQIPASVIAIIPTADRAKATVQVRIQLELQDQRILPDMGVKVAFLKKDQTDEHE